jgi:UDPglucose--hexose-1-phosphate uridylyltransferase
VQKRRIDGADGRYVYLYAFERALPDVLDVKPAPRSDEQVELRWNQLLGERVVISTGRQERTFLPSDEDCPLCPTREPGKFVTEIPARDFEIAVFENRFPSFRADAPAVQLGSPLDRRARARGACEVIVYTSEHEATLGTLSREKARRLVDVWCDRYGELAALADVRYVFIFENRGKEIGVTLTHPHGQIYAFPYVPPRVQREDSVAFEHREHYRTCLVCDLAGQERKAAVRVVAEAGGFMAYVPFAARVPYEVHIASVEHRASLLELTEVERDGLAALLPRIAGAYDALWDVEMPYTMSMHQRATGEDAADAHLHIEFMPMLRARGKLKYLAGVETGAGTFINDTSPEEKAAELRAALARLAPA